MAKQFTPQVALGAAIRELRQERGMDQKRLAAAAKLDEASLSQLENGSKNPEWATVRRLADALGVTVSEIAAREEEIEAREA